MCVGALPGGSVMEMRNENCERGASGIENFRAVACKRVN